MPDEVWAAFQIPIGLAFLMRSSVTGGVVALYPSPAGATESELELTAWDALCAANPVLDRLEPDAEALIVDRTSREHRYAIVRIDRCYALVGLVKERWSGITGGPGVGDRDRGLLRGPARDGRRRHEPPTRRWTRGDRSRDRPGVLRARRRARPPHADARAALRPARQRPARARDPHARAVGRDPHRPGAARLRRRDARQARRAVRRARALGGDDAGAALGAGRRARPGLHGRDVVRDRGALRLRPRGRGDQVPVLAAGRRGAALVPVHRDGPLRRRARPAAGRAGALERDGALADAGRGVPVR